jgi:repressor LexA
MIKLTPRQKEAFSFIRKHIGNAGRPPTRREIADHFGWSSANAAEDHLRALSRKGAITIDAGKSRGIVL